MGKIVKKNTKRDDGIIVSDHWRTPRFVFEELHHEFGFDLDCAADQENNLLPRWLGTGGLATDALKVRWCGYGKVGFLNPGYSSASMRRFMAHAAAQTVAFPSGHDALDVLVCLVPYDPSVGWWQSTYGAAEVREIPFRLKFDKPLFDAGGVIVGLEPTQAMFPSAVVVYRRRRCVIAVTRQLSVWDPRRAVE